MATVSEYPLRLPPSLIDDLRAAAERDGVSLNGFIVQAVAEKLAVLRARGLTDRLTVEEQRAILDARAHRGSNADLRELIGKAGSAGAVLPGDELPEGWETGVELAAHKTASGQP